MTGLRAHGSKSANRKKKRQRSTEDYIGGVGDELAEEDLLVGVEGVDDEREQLVDLRLEGEGLGLRGHGAGSWDARARGGDGEAGGGGGRRWMARVRVFERVLELREARWGREDL